ncbi:zinc finger protein 41 isoform 2-T3 [Thomomys bottae]
MEDSEGGLRRSVEKRGRQWLQRSSTVDGIQGLIRVIDNCKSHFSDCFPESIKDQSRAGGRMQEPNDFVNFPMSLNPYAKIYKRDQHRELENYFKMDGYPDYKARVTLAARLNLKEHDVRVWFRMRRATNAKAEYGPQKRRRKLGWFSQVSVVVKVSNNSYSDDLGIGNHSQPNPCWALPIGESGFSLCDQKDSNQKGFSNFSFKPFSYQPIVSSGTASSLGSTELRSTTEAFQRLSVSVSTSESQSGDGRCGRG